MRSVHTTTGEKQTESNEDPTQPKKTQNGSSMSRIVLPGPLPRCGFRRRTLSAWTAWGAEKSARPDSSQLLPPVFHLVPGGLRP